MAQGTNYEPPPLIPLIPVASPVDTFSTQPQVPQPLRDTRFADLAEGLSSFDKDLRYFMEARAKADTESETLKGMAAFYKGHAGSFAEATADGTIPAQTNPHFIAGWKKAQGSVAGYDLQGKFSAAYEKFDKTSEDPQAFTKFAQGFIKDNMSGTQDPAVLKGLMPHINTILSNGAARYQADRHKVVYNGALQTMAGQVANEIEAGQKQGLVTGQVDYPAINARVLGHYNEQVRVGGNPIDVSKVVIEAVKNAAISSRDPKVLDALGQKIPGKDITFGSTEHGLEAKQQALNTIDTLKRRDMHDNKQLQKDKDEAEENRLTVSIIDSLRKDPRAPLPEAELNALTKYNKNARLEVLEWQKKLLAGEGGPSDPAALTKLHKDLFEGGGAAVIKKGLEDGVFKNPADLDRAATILKTVTDAGPKGDAILKHPAAVETHAAIVSRFPQNAELMNKFGGIASGLTDKGRDASNNLNLMLLDWAAKNPNATAFETQKFIKEASDLVLGGAGPVVPFKERGYTTPEGVPTEGTPPPSRAPLAPKPAAAPPAATAPIPPPDVDLDAWSSKEFNNEQLGRIAADALRKKVPLEDRLKQLYDQRQKQQPSAPSGVPIKPLSTDAIPDLSAPKDENLSAPVRAIIDATLKQPPENRAHVLEKEILDIIKMGMGTRAAYKPKVPFAAQSSPGDKSSLTSDPKAAQLLDFVSEKESGGKYNAVIGNVNSTQDLSKLTISEVYALQRQLVNSGMPSSAVGRYQIIGKTLRGLVEQMGIDPATTKFTPEVQDQMGLTLLRTRGYDRWKAGGMSDAQFANNLSMEWAALPSPEKDGRSYHAGVGNNRAGMTLGRVYAALKTFRDVVSGGR